MPTTHHPADLRHRQHLVATLRTLRIEQGMDLQAIADDLHLTRGAVSRFERQTTNPRIPTVQRYARTLAHRLVLQITGIPGLDNGDRMPVDLGDSTANVQLLADMVAARRHLGLRLQNVADQMGTTRSAVCDLETNQREARMSTYQRYARALGGRLAGQIVAAPSVDMVQVERVHAGAERFGTLTDAEQVALFRRYGATSTATRLQERWHVSSARYKAVAALVSEAA